MSTSTQRRCNVGIPPKPAPLNLTDLQHKLHKESTAQTVSSATRGAFGGRAAHNRRVKAPANLLPASSPIV
jgi:hypothetical protein